MCVCVCVCVCVYVCMCVCVCVCVCVCGLGVDQSPGREGIKEMSTDTIGSHPTFIIICRIVPTSPTAGDWPDGPCTLARRPMTSRGLDLDAGVPARSWMYSCINGYLNTAVNKLFTGNFHIP